MESEEKKAGPATSTAKEEAVVATAEDSVPATTAESGTAGQVPAFQLPVAPSGQEVLDLLWAQMAPEADEVLARLPEGAAESWGDARGITSYLVALSDVIDATKAVEATVAPKMRRMRQRDLRRRRWWLSQCTLLTAAVYARRARVMYPDAQPSQVLLLVRDQLRRATAELMATNAEPEANAGGAHSTASCNEVVASRG